jgi:hypothetical protein
VHLDPKEGIGKDPFTELVEIYRRAEQRIAPIFGSDLLPHPSTPPTSRRDIVDDHMNVD